MAIVHFAFFPYSKFPEDQVTEGSASFSQTLYDEYIARLALQMLGPGLIELFMIGSVALLQSEYYGITYIERTEYASDANKSIWTYILFLVAQAGVLGGGIYYFPYDYWYIVVALQVALSIPSFEAINQIYLRACIFDYTCSPGRQEI
eukprot:CAMPEP_0168616318 /NCGR_PEP_ID=MMETSP0449_2-20121227/4966_1 /TAXON_ID=1082188 /ORGANISM="Strombidium rassoulzadegani, Strain ras09" /LENGTH=147 /DNA_ID=CAMNT_0008657101 /DNA_START=97 /DNA_END=540 /DNA_ORIENTATION=+